MKLAGVTFLECHPIGDGPKGPLLIRYIIAKCAFFGICVHKLCRADYDRALHDHPWWFISLVLRGYYIEEYRDRELSAHWEQSYDPNPFDPFLQNGAEPMEIRQRLRRNAGSIAFRPARHRHRVMLGETMTLPSGPWDGIPAWTLVIMGPRVRKWGFWVDGKWCWWRKHNADLNICEDGIVHQGGGD